MRFQTRDFGEVEIEASQIIQFQQPIFGFEDFPKYAFLHDPEAGSDVAWLQSIDEPGLCFILINPKMIAAYMPELPSNLSKMVGEGDVDCWLMAVVMEEFVKSTVNLKSPVVINWKTGLGAQLILEGDYPIRYPLVKEADGKC